ncbi:MAG: DUF2244 domain-containing protein [Alphaproteobacteria bacterium]|nr:DUF2244 domain-containing protein [Alphaproteobacteria bacterium]
MEQAQPIFETVVRPHRSLTLFGFRLLMTVLIISNGVFAVAMILHGAWPVVGFLGLDVLGVYIAFRLSYAQTRAFERITIADSSLVITRVDERGRSREWRYPSYWASVGYDEHDDERGILTVGSHGKRIEVGRFLHRKEREQLARQLRDALLRSRSYSAPT